MFLKSAFRWEIERIRKFPGVVGADWWGAMSNRYWTRIHPRDTGTLVVGGGGGGADRGVGARSAREVCVHPHLGGRAPRR